MKTSFESPKKLTKDEINSLVFNPTVKRIEERTSQSPVELVGKITHRKYIDENLIKGMNAQELVDFAQGFLRKSDEKPVEATIAVAQAVNDIEPPVGADPCVRPESVRPENIDSETNPEKSVSTWKSWFKNTGERLKTVGEKVKDFFFVPEEKLAKIEKIDSDLRKELEVGLIKESVKAQKKHEKTSWVAKYPWLKNTLKKVEDFKIAAEGFTLGALIPAVSRVVLHDPILTSISGGISGLYLKMHLTKLVERSHYDFQTIENEIKNFRSKNMDNVLSIAACSGLIAKLENNNKILADKKDYAKLTELKNQINHLLIKRLMAVQANKEECGIWIYTAPNGDRIIRSNDTTGKLLDREVYSMIQRMNAPDKERFANRYSQGLLTGILSNLATAAYGCASTNESKTPHYDNNKDYKHTIMGKPVATDEVHSHSHNHPFDLQKGVNDTVGANPGVCPTKNDHVVVAQNTEKNSATVTPTPTYKHHSESSVYYDSKANENKHYYNLNGNKGTDDNEVTVTPAPTPKSTPTEENNTVNHTYTTTDENGHKTYHSESDYHYKTGDDKSEYYKVENNKNENYYHVKENDPNAKMYEVKPNDPNQNNDNGGLGGYKQAGLPGMGGVDNHNHLVNGFGGNENHKPTYMNDNLEKYTHDKSTGTDSKEFLPQEGEKKTYKIENLWHGADTDGDKKPQGQNNFENNWGEKKVTHQTNGGGDTFDTKNGQDNYKTGDNKTGGNDTFDTKGGQDEFNTKPENKIENNNGGNDTFTVEQKNSNANGGMDVFDGNTSGGSDNFDIKTNVNNGGNDVFNGSPEGGSDQF